MLHLFESPAGRSEVDMINEQVNLMKHAEAMEYDSVWPAEHHFTEYGVCASPALTLAAIARETSKIRLGTGVLVLPFYNPIRVAEEFAMLDVMSGGRLVAGFPVGTPMDTNFCYGQIPALTRDKYYEAHELIMRAWSESEPFAFDGKYNQLRYVNCWPKPIQKPHPPIYIPGGGSIETWDFCVEQDYNYSFLSFGGYKAGKALLSGFWDRVGASGKDESPGRASFAQIICVAETDTEAEDLYAEHILYFYNRCLHVYPGFAEPPGYRTLKTIKAGKLSQLRSEQQQRFQTLTWKNLIEEGMVIAGSPDTVREQCEHMIKELRLGTVFCLLHMGNMPDEKTRYSTRLFAERVMPQLQKLWPEYDDDDRWWPTPYADRTRPEQPGGERP
jgi:alkanesulfonate monooxygenase SsuD/methylene tetrahydromethanopterin reductase-like flavin-dependent oxidoreductase (luciferase family)